MATQSKTKSRFEQFLSEIYARRPRENNKRVCIDCLKPRSNKIKFECKNCGCAEFYLYQIIIYDYQNPSFEILSSL